MNRFYTIFFFLGLSIVAHAQQNTIKLKTIDHKFKYAVRTDYDVFNFEDTKYDKTNCLDTLREYKEVFALSAVKYSYKLRKYQTSYYANGKKKQVIYSSGIDTLNPTSKSTYTYSLTNVKPDTITNESWDSKTLKWAASSKTLTYKSVNNKDSLVRSFDNTNTEAVYIRYYYATDGKDSLILKTSSITGLTIDSTFYKYDSQRRTTHYKFMRYNTTTPRTFNVQAEQKWQYEGDKLLSYYKSNYFSGTTPYYIDSTFTSAYTGNTLSSMEEKYIKRNASTLAVLDSSYERSRYLAYNTANKPTSIEMDEWDATNARWKRMANITREYAPDSLIKKETRTEIGVRTGIITYDEYKIYTYETCQTLTSSTPDIVQDLSFKIAPNPANSDIRIHLEEGNQEPAQMTIFSLQGNLIQSKRLTETASSVDVSALARGMYLVKIQQGNRFAVKKLTLF
jgi:hypothetical protein